MATTLLQDVEILAAGTRLNVTKNSEGEVQQFRSVTLLVTPEQAAKLTLAQSVGTLSLTLRNDHDDGDVPPRVFDMDELPFIAERRRQEALDDPDQPDSNAGGQPATEPQTKTLELRGNVSRVRYY